MRTNKLCVGRIAGTWLRRVHLIGLLLMLSPPLAASSLVQEQLATVQSVQITVATGGLLYDPLPGFERAEFERIASRKVAAHLDKCGIETLDSAPQTFVLVLRKETADLPDGRVVVSIDAELREPALLVRSWRQDGRNNQSLTVTTWSSQLFVVVDRNGGVEQLMELIDTMAGRFAHAAGSARNRLGPENWKDVPDSCFEDH